MSNIASTLAPHAKTVGFAATGGVAANNVQDAIAELGGDVTTLDTTKSPTTHTTHTGEVVSQQASGYKKFADGTIIQWGVTPSSASQTITFPIAFPAACYSVVTNPITAVSALFAVPGDITATQFTLKTWDANPAPYASSSYWQAIGR